MNLIIEDTSRYDFNTTVEKIASAASDAGWRVPATHDLQNTIRNFGKEILPVTVIEICHPGHSSRLLELDSHRFVSNFMPCRISVYEKSDGKVYISRMNASVIAKGYGGLTEEVMTSTAAEMEQMLVPLISDESSKPGKMCM